MSKQHPIETELSDFQPLDPWKSSELVVRSRKLPHLEVAGATYFVTFRCHSKFQLPPQAHDLVMTVIQEQVHKTIALDAAVVMPDHVHAIFRVIEPYTLSQVLQHIKGRSSRQINQILGRQGRVWLVESFDHIIRHAHELEEKIEYIRQNPAKQGLEDSPNSYRWLFVKESTG
ncbi:MAG: transposase [Deltaproteobacteria bacterium]|nr:transposase [Deltaproteobacteria bacterium]